MSAGIIIPPVEIRKLVEDVAARVAEKGPNLEEIIKVKLAQDPRFSFLHFNNPYRSFYDQKVAEFMAGGPRRIDEEKSEDNEVRAERPAPPEPKFCFDCGTLGVAELDMIMLAAQFVAKHGRQFLTTLTSMEMNNPQFEFLKPTNSLFPYFTSLVDGYGKILNTKPEELEALQEQISDSKRIFNECLEVYQYESEAGFTKRRKEEIEEEERQQRAMINWDDFVVVQTIDFDDDAALPAPMDVASREKMINIEYSRANINPDFAVLLDASQAYVHREKQKLKQPSEIASQMDIEISKSQQPKNPSSAQQTNKAMMAAALLTSGGQTNIITVNFRLAKDERFGMMSGRQTPLPVDPSDSADEVKQKICSRLSIRFPVVFRTAEHESIEGSRSLAEFGVYNLIMMEIVPA